MPKLDSTIHLDMFRAGKRSRNLAIRIRKAIKELLGRNDVYGLEWGDPEVIPPLSYVREHFLIPYLSPNATIVEIGPGGGRWTRYMLNAKRIYAVDYHQELLSELKSNIDATNITYIRNNGNDFPNIQEGSVDFLFSFGAFCNPNWFILSEVACAHKRVSH